MLALKGRQDAFRLLLPKEFLYKDIEEKTLIAKIKEIWVAEGNKIKDIKDLNIYAKPEDDACYYTINGDFSGHIKLYE